VLGAADALFVLDALQMRAQVRQQAQAAFDFATVLALIKITASFIVAAILTFAAWRAVRASRKPKSETAGTAVLVGRRPAAHPATPAGAGAGAHGATGAAPDDDEAPPAGGPS